MGPKKRGTTTRKRKATSAASGAPPSKIKLKNTSNTELKKVIAKIKSSDKKKIKTIKPDETFSFQYANVSIHKDYACMLNQTNIGQNNNKYYVIQVGNIKNCFVCFTKWGRVGEAGQNSSQLYLNVKGAIQQFEKKFKDKTGNHWSQRSKFQPKKGKYTLIEMDPDEEISSPATTNNNATIKDDDNCNVECNLDKRTQLMIKLIFDSDMFVNQMSNMKLNTNKMPLGNLSKSQIAKGFEILIDIEEAIKKKKGNLNELSSRFYTIIPHDFGRLTPPVIRTKDEVDTKKEMMMTLSDIELTQSIQKKQKDVAKIHPLDAKYASLHAELTLLDKKSEEFKLLYKYAKASKDTRKGPLLDAWRVDREGTDDRFKQSKNIKYRKLLWHGTNIAVVAAILKAGLRIMPHSGGSLGRGIYFASEHAKSSWYCRPFSGVYAGEKNVGFMFLAEVALGNMKDVNSCDCLLTKAPQGYQSVVGRGREEPNPKSNMKVKFDGQDVEVPVGSPIPQKEFLTSPFCKSEYLIYKESQARIRYILKFSFA